MAFSPKPEWTIPNGQATAPRLVTLGNTIVASEFGSALVFNEELSDPVTGNHWGVGTEEIYRSSIPIDLDLLDYFVL